MSCNLIVLDSTKLLKMVVAGILIVLGSTLFEFNIFIATTLYVLGWIFAASMVKTDYKIYSAISIIALSFLGFKIFKLWPLLFLYSAGWIFLASQLSNQSHLRWIVAGLSLISGFAALNKDFAGLGQALHLGAWVLLSVLIALPDASTFKDSVGCVELLHNKELSCMAESGCFKKVPKTPEEIADLVACLAGKCSSYGAEAKKVDCLINKCLPGIEKNPPKDLSGWIAALGAAYMGGCSKGC